MQIKDMFPMRSCICFCWTPGYVKNLGTHKILQFEIFLNCGVGEFQDGKHSEEI